MTTRFNYPVIYAPHELPSAAIHSAAIPFTVLALSGTRSEDALVVPRDVFGLCGGIYVYGSIAALREGLPLALRVFSGITLNMLGAWAWLSAFMHEGWWGAGVIGAGLSLVWIRVVVREFQEEWH